MSGAPTHVIGSDRQFYCTDPLCAPHIPQPATPSARSFFDYAEPHDIPDGLNYVPCCESCSEPIGAFWFEAYGVKHPGAAA